MTDLEQLRLRDYRPVPRLSAPSHRVGRACAPVIDAHTHLGRWLSGGTWAAPSTARLAELMDSCNIAAVVNMDGRWGAGLPNSGGSRAARVRRSCVTLTGSRAAARLLGKCPGADSGLQH